MNKEYHREYNLKRCHRLRSEYIELMGGRCKCGSTLDLQFDHKDPKTKSFDVSKRITYPKSVVLAELAKCQLLCKPCHLDKTMIDLGKKKAKGTHGTLSSFRYCKCDLCKQAKRAYMRAWKAGMAERSKAAPL